MATTKAIAEHDVRKLEYAPHAVYLTLDDDGEITPSGGNELLDSEWLTPDEVDDDNSRFFCRTCDVGFDSEAAAKAHLRGDVGV